MSDETLLSWLRNSLHAQNTQADVLINTHIEQGLARLPQRDGSTCLLVDLNISLIRAASVLSFVANSVANGETVQHYIRSNIEQMDEESDFSELDPLEKLEEKHWLLKYYSLELQRTFSEMTDKWQLWDANSSFRPASSPSVGLSNTSPSGEQYQARVAPSSNAAQATSSYRTSLQAGYFPRPIPTTAPAPRTNVSPGSTQTSPPEADELEDRVNQLLATLNARGKGQHFCPYGYNCARGGRTTAGALIIFERNSDFKTHLQKHGRQYKCNLPNCPNQKGFARMDQLVRHQETVSHGLPQSYMQ